MFAPSRYLQWARRFYGQVKFDLATSGMPTVRSGELRLPGPAAPAETDDAAAWASLCEQIASHNDVTASEVLPALGTTQALWLACASLTSPGDEVIVEEPAYEPLLRIAEGCGARVVSVPRDPRAGFALDPERIASAMTPRTRAVLVTNLHNPSGVRTGDDSLRAIARAAQRWGAFLVVDEVYSAFDAFIDARGVFRGSARKLAPNVIAVSSLTKCYGLGPERIGWLLGPREIIDRAGDALVATTGMLPRSHVRAASAAFAELPALAARSRRLLSGKRERVAAWVASHQLAWSAPAEGLFGLVSMPGRDDLTPAIEKAAREHQVLVAAGSFFGMPDAFRIAWSIPADRLDEGLGRLAEALAL
jgi:aspartate/methionine/tyrosine aminotransferase